MNLSSEHCVVPTSLLIKCLLCYYGGAPRAEEVGETAPEEIMEQLPNIPVMEAGQPRFTPNAMAAAMMGDRSDHPPTP